MIRPPSTATSPTEVTWSTSVNTAICLSLTSLTTEKYRRYSVLALIRPCMARISAASSGPDGRRCTTPPSASRTSASQCWGYATGRAVPGTVVPGSVAPGTGAPWVGATACWSVTRIMRVEAMQRIELVAGLLDGPVDRQLLGPVPPVEFHQRGSALVHVDRQDDVRPGLGGGRDPVLRQHDPGVEIMSGDDGQQMGP